MSEISGGKKIVAAIRQFVNEGENWNMSDNDRGIDLNFKGTKALLSYIDALEEVVEETKRKIAIDFVCYDPIGSQGAIGYRDDDECRLCEWQFICQALAKLREMDKPLPTFDDVKGILADGEE